MSIAKDTQGFPVFAHRAVPGQKPGETPALPANGANQPRILTLSVAEMQAYTNAHSLMFEDIRVLGFNSAVWRRERREPA